MTLRTAPLPHPLVRPAQALSDPSAGVQDVPDHDPLTSHVTEWVRQARCIEVAGLASAGAWLQHMSARAAAARSWTDWLAVAGTSVEEAMDDVARTQGEWLSALVQCEMELTKMWLEFGGVATPSAAPLSIGWLAPWWAGAGLRPVAIA